MIYQIDTIINSARGECWQETRRAYKYSLRNMIADMLKRYEEENPTEFIREVSVEVKEVVYSDGTE